MTNDESQVSKQEELQEYLMKLDIIKAQLEGLTQQSEIFELTSNELIRAKETLTKLKNADGNNDILIPIGGDTFLFAAIDDVKKILIGIGANTVIEQSTDEAIDKLDKRLADLNQTSQSIIQSIQILQQQANDINMKVQGLYRELQGAGL